jgi:hypothetical protein
VAQRLGGAALHAEHLRPLTAEIAAPPSRRSRTHSCPDSPRTSATTAEASTTHDALTYSPARPA